ncbi:MAG: glycosyltransferase family 39 protein [Planctomycetes bacterium]|nr:glycosyltransferase family 39 protein [Planctomycetota bacterium]
MSGKVIAIPREKMSSRELWGVAAVVVAALLIRATRLSESLWYDEIAAWFSFGQHGPGWIISHFSEPSNHIAHTLLSFCSAKLFEQAIGFELALRLPALLFSLGAVVGIYALARPTGGRARRRAALIAAVLMAVLPVAVLEGVEARGYSMMICFSALATSMFFAARAGQRPWQWGLYAALCAVGIWAHFVTAFVPIGHLAWLIWRAARHGEQRQAFSGGVAIGLAAAAAIALYAPALPDMRSHIGMYLAARGDEPSVFATEGLHALWQLGGSWYAWATWPGLLVAIIGLVVLMRNTQTIPRETAAAALLGLPIFLVTVVLAGSWMYARFTLFALPGTVLLTAVGVDALWRWKRVAGLTALAMVVGFSAADLIVRPAKQPLRDAANYVRSNRTDDETILVIGLAHRVLEIYLADLQPKYSLHHGADLPQKLAQMKPTWIILYYPGHVSPNHYALLGEHGYLLAERFEGWVDWGSGDVLVYRRQEPGEAASGATRRPARGGRADQSWRRATIGSWRLATTAG